MKKIENYAKTEGHKDTNTLALQDAIREILKKSAKSAIGFRPAKRVFGVSFFTIGYAQNKFVGSIGLQLTAYYHKTSCLCAI